ncbi:hypothetical protein SAMN02910292_02947 [Lachnospiraceae bacterium XBB2008]|nr:hypothetical protein SAMN02910292_02947 [Lachnospiraceae bacterium XBB2008]
MKQTKCLAYIWPAESIDGKEQALAYVRFITGPYEKKTGKYLLTTNIYKYYFWGVTFEAVTIQDDGSIIEVSDVKRDEWESFGLSIIHALSWNSITHEVLGSNGFVYKLDQSVFYRVCGRVCDHIYEQIESAENIVMQMYTLSGGIIAILFDKDIPKSHPSYKYAIQRGFVTADNTILRSMVTIKEISADNKEVLKQDDIDKLLEKLSGASLCLSMDETTAIGYMN